jgi:hypothetical protein
MYTTKPYEGKDRFTILHYPKRMDFTIDSVFLIQCGKGKKGRYTTAYRVESNGRADSTDYLRALHHYNYDIRPLPGLKKRLIVDGKCVDRQVYDEACRGWWMV